ncbi:hypothetical protein GCM10009775_35130 [Microbacterium aoyamense]|uniref:FMN-binding domain-containing protein n=1 Tax=Microbacterium aoyamense TaxID=344166 RepID=A0ABP5BEN8_9MICO|nr:hypothetical protein [Microbacterium aoyamense]
MIRTTAASRTAVRFGTVATVGFAGALALAGCTSPATTDTGSGTDSGSSTGEYTDGTYTAEGTYQTPESVETISVTVALEDGIITSVDVEGDPQKAESQQYQGQFIGGISDEVVGKSIDEISVSRVAGSSLTSGGFNDAIETIKAEAAA